MNFLIRFCFCLAVFTSPLLAQEVTPKTISSNLKNPWGIAVRPVTGEIYVSDTGRGRVIEVGQEKVDEVVVEFPISEFELDRGIVLGPLALAFRDRNKLLVASGGESNGEDGISTFDLEQLGSTPFKAGEDAVAVLKIEEANGEPALGNFFAMTAANKSLYVVGSSNNDKGWVSRAGFVAAETKDFERLIPTNKLSRLPNPGGVTVSPDGHIVVGQMGKRDVAADSTLCFYSKVGELLDKFPTGLNDIVAVAYGPRNGRLFALDYSWVDPSKGGLYKLVAVDNKEGCEAVLVAKLDRPTAMAFDQNGNLWVTICGLSNKRQSIDSEFVAPGKVLMLPGIDN